MSSVVIDEGYKVMATNDFQVVRQSLHIRMDQIELISAPIVLVEEWMSVLLP